MQLEIYNALKPSLASHRFKQVNKEYLVIAIIAMIGLLGICFVFSYDVSWLDQQGIVSLTGK